MEKTERGTSRGSTTCAARVTSQGGTSDATETARRKQRGGNSAEETARRKQRGGNSAAVCVHWNLQDPNTALRFGGADRQRSRALIPQALSEQRIEKEQLRRSGTAIRNNNWLCNVRIVVEKCSDPEPLLLRQLASHRHIICQHLSSVRRDIVCKRNSWAGGGVCNTDDVPALRVSMKLTLRKWRRKTRKNTHLPGQVERICNTKYLRLGDGDAYVMGLRGSVEISDTLTEA